MVGLSESDDSGRCDAKEEFLGNVMGMENELPKGMTPNSVGGAVVLPRCSLDEAESSSKSILISTAGSSNDFSMKFRLATSDVTFDSREVGHDTEMLEHWGG